MLDAAIELAELRPARFGFETSLSVNFQNLGSIPVDSFALELDCGDHFSFTGLSTLNSGGLLHPLNLSNGTLSAVFKGADVLQQRNFVAYGQLDSFLLPGDTLPCTARVLPFPANDAVAGNNFDSLLPIVQGSYDPNDITAYPQGRITSASLDADGSLDLVYRIRFENTGNANADFLRVVTDYSPLLRPETFRLGAVSAPCSVRFLEGNRMEFSFPNYLLPPTSVDSLASKGFIFFRMRTVPGLVAGDTIKNKADIYFDFNPPIHTNTAMTWVESGSTATGHPADEVFEFFLLPNPVRAGTTVRFSGDLPSWEKWQMFSVDGRVVAEGRVADGISVQASGMYRVVCGHTTRGLVVLR